MEIKNHYTIDDDGIIRVKNPLAPWLSDVTLNMKIGNTEYTVTGSYGGNSTFVPALKRLATFVPDESTEENH